MPIEFYDCACPDAITDFIEGDGPINGQQIKRLNNFLSLSFQPVDSCLTQFDNYIGCDGSRAKSYFCLGRHYKKTHTLTIYVLMDIGESNRRAAARRALLELNKLTQIFTWREEDIILLSTRCAHSVRREATHTPSGDNNKPGSPILVCFIYK